MRSLNQSTRAKAIEIANQLIEQGEYDKRHVVSLSVERARGWARIQRDWSSVNGQLYA